MAVTTASRSMLESFVIDEDVATLAVVDDMWYFIVSEHGGWIMGG
jgi:YydF family exported signaling peptide